MSRRLIVQTAQSLRRVRPRDLHNRVTWREACEAVAQAFGDLNARFERQRFLNDCGVDLPTRPDAS